MPIPELHFEDERKGLPRQPVPLRYAVLISELTVLQLVEMTTHAFQLDDYVIISLLDCYEFSGGKIRTCNASSINSIYGETKKLDTEKERMKHLPSNWFVYSDDLVSAFSNWVDLTVGREYASANRMGLNWDPSLHPFERDVKACSIMPASKSAMSPREKGKKATAQKHNAWYTSFLDLKKQKSKHSDSYIAGLVAKKYGSKKATVRRVISDCKKNS